MTGATPHRGLMVLSHGRDSSPQAKKIGLLRPMAAERGWRTEVPDYRGMDATGRVRLLLETIGDYPGRVALAGSSMGGIVSVLAAQRRPVEGLFLMAPAVYWQGYEDMNHGVNADVIHIIHGWRDDVVGADQVIRFARENRATLHLIDDDHLLAERTADLERLFEDFLDQLERSHVAGPAS